VQIELHVPSVRNAEIKGTAHSENPLSWMGVWPHALETSREILCRCCVLLCRYSCRCGVCVRAESSDTSQLSQKGRRWI